MRFNSIMPSRDGFACSSRHNLLVTTSGDDKGGYDIIAAAVAYNLMGYSLPTSTTMLARDILLCEFRIPVTATILVGLLWQ